MFNLTSSIILSKLPVSNSKGNGCENNLRRHFLRYVLVNICMMINPTFDTLNLLSLCEFK